MSNKPFSLLASLLLILGLSALAWGLIYLFCIRPLIG